MPAGFIYRQNKNRKHAIVGMAVGTVCMAVVGGVINGFVLLPVYDKLFHMPIEVIVEKGSAIIPAIDSVFKFCLFSVVPFNLIKGIVVSAVTLLLYKHISRLLKGSQA